MNALSDLEHASMNEAPSCYEKQERKVNSDTKKKFDTFSTKTDLAKLLIANSFESGPMQTPWKYNRRRIGSMNEALSCYEKQERNVNSDTKKDFRKNMGHFQDTNRFSKIIKVEKIF